MADGHASLDSLDLFKELRASLIGFAEDARLALADADSEIGRTIQFLDQQAPHWRGQVRRLEEELKTLKDQIRQKTLFKTQIGATGSVVDEKKQAAMLQRRLEEAQARLKNVERWRRLVETEAMQYRGLVQPVGRLAEEGVPRAVALLDRLADALDRYVALQAEREPREAGAGDAGASMARPEGEAEAGAEPAADEEAKP